MLRSYRTFVSNPAVASMLGAAATFATVAAYAQDAVSGPTQALEEVVVTAERRVEDAQKTGASISVRRGEALQNEGKFSLKSILEDVPGITGGAAFGTAGSGGGGTDTPAAGLIIRGIPSNVGAGGSTTSTAPAAAIYVDGVYNGIGGGYDIDRVEVLRGPQGTLYGRSATAGLVAIHTYAPDLGELDGNATLEFGNHELQHYTGALNVPLIADKLAVRVAGNRYERDGFDNGADGGVRHTEGKIKVLYQPNSNVSLLVGAAIQNNDDHTGGRVVGFNPDHQQVVYVDVPVGDTSNDFKQYWAELNWDLGFAALTYLPAFRSWTQEGTIIGDGAFGYVTQPVRTPKDEFTTHEIRLTSNADSTLSWQVGALYYKNDLSNTNSTFLGDPVPQALVYTDDVTKETKALGAFAQVTYPLADTWRLTGGARYDKTDVAATEVYQIGAFLTGGAPLPPPFTLSGAAGERDFSNWTYKLRLEHDVTPTSLLYASVSTGFSPGDVTVTASCPADLGPPPCPLELEAETLTAYEIGSKSRFLDETLQVNTAAFYSDYGAFQSAAINVSDVPGPPLFATLSSAVQVYGVEFDLLYKPTIVDLVSFNFAWTNAYYVDKPARFARYVAEDDVANSDAPGSVAPIPLTAALAYEHTFNLSGSSLKLRGDVRYVSEHDGHVTLAQLQDGIEPLVESESAVIGNFIATWEATANITVGFYVRNVADERFFEKVAADRVPTGAYIFRQTLSDPRTYGAVLNVSF